MLTYIASALLALSVAADSNRNNQIDEANVSLYTEYYEDNGKDWGTVVEILDDGNFGTTINWPTCGTG